MMDKYNRYTSREGLYISCKEFYTDSDGFPNANAFRDFGGSLDENGDYRLICMNVDLRKSNAVSYSFGSYILRKLILSFQNCYCFRIQGEKFNIIVEKKHITEVKELLDAPDKCSNSCCEIYYGIVDEPYLHSNSAELLQKGIDLMYRDKMQKRRKARSNNALIGDKSGTPVELQETAMRKYRRTMWYSTVKISVSEPEYKELTVYVYPTEFCRPLESIPLIAVTDDMLNYDVLYGKNIKFGINGIIFTINARFDREGHLNISVFRDDNGECGLEINTHEGVCIPANFGKRIGSKEIYPIKKNIQGFCDYVLLDNGKAELNTSGIVNICGKAYGVHIDDFCIDLIPIDETE